jgi:phytoene synthase
VDGAVDSGVHGRLDAVRSVLQRAEGALYAADGHPVVQALGDAIRRFGLPHTAFADILRGMEMDLQGVRYERFDDLRLYCERVAGAVGRLCLEVFGYRDADAPRLGVEMGIALQLTNVLRDLREDLQLGRIYLPREEVEAAGYSLEDLRALRHTPAFDRLLAQQVRRAQGYYQRAEALFAMVEPDARLSLMALHAIYRELLSVVAASGGEVLRCRVRVPTARKLLLVGTLLLRQRWAARDPATPGVQAMPGQKAPGDTAPHEVP